MNGVTVTAAPLAASESQDEFAAPLAPLDIQPVWIRVENPHNEPFWLFPIGVDPNYYSPYEAARRAASLSRQSVDELSRRFVDRAIPVFIPAGGTVEGFVYADADEGVKAFNVDLVGKGHLERAHFAMTVPGLPTDYNDAELAKAAAEQHPAPLDLMQLRRWLEALGCCAADSEGWAGDPINIALVGSLDTIRGALVSAGWDVSVRISTAAVWQMIGAYLFADRDRYAPVSPLNLFGRQQDLAMQRARAEIDERNHLRLWQAPVTADDLPVWVGQISRDIDIELSGHLWPPTTHVIGPEVDDARSFLLQDLLYAHQVARVGFTSGVGAAPQSHPRRNAEGDPYFTDGLRVVLFLSDRQVAIEDAELLPWHVPPAMSPGSALEGDLPRR